MMDMIEPPQHWLQNKMEHKKLSGCSQDTQSDCMEI